MYRSCTPARSNISMSAASRGCSRKNRAHTSRASSWETLWSGRATAVDAMPAMLVMGSAPSFQIPDPSLRSFEFPAGSGSWKLAPVPHLARHDMDNVGQGLDIHPFSPGGSGGGVVL